MQGQVVHFEVPFGDGDRARSFYREIFGWFIQEIPDMGFAAYFEDSEGNLMGLWENSTS